MNILAPPKSYIDYRCYTHGLSGPELSSAQERFYRKNPDARGEIISLCNWLANQRTEGTLPVERIEVREQDGKKHGRVVNMMVFDVEYWLENGQIRSRKIYVPVDHGEPGRLIDQKARASGEREPGEEG